MTLYQLSMKLESLKFAGGGQPAAAVLLEGLHEGFAVEGLQAHASAGNGIEFRGGSANCYYCAASEAGGTGLAWGRGLDRDRRQEARKVSAPYTEGS